jgi:putative molybdopterin biosynthesis protein
LVKRTIYLDNLNLEEALEKFLARVVEAQKCLHQVETIPVEQSIGRITTGPVYARASSPHYNAAAMDGIAVRAVDTTGARETNPVQLALGVQAFAVDTGDCLPPGCDAVVMIEQVTKQSSDFVDIIAAVTPWQHVRPIGEDLVATEMIIPGNHLIGPYDLGALLAGGIAEVAVKKVPRVGIIPTGTELVVPGAQLKPGNIIEYNSHVLGGLVTEWGGLVQRYPIVVDNYQLIKTAISKATQENDIVIINAGSSAGSEDFSASAIQDLGELICHGVAIKPGKPVIIGVVAGKPIVGVPGYPVSAALTCELFVKPVVELFAGVTLPSRPRLEAVLSRQLVSPLGQEEFVRVKCGKVGDKFVATPIARGAGIIMSLVRADGIMRVPRLSEGFHAGKTVEIQLFRPAEAVAKTSVIIGSHDLIVDLLANQLSLDFPGWTLSSAHVGSLGGLMAIRRGEAHLAGVHLLDPATGEYNVPYLVKYLDERSLILVNLAYREQGLLVPKGNPLAIKGLPDLSGGVVRYINRQRGAGTRVLLDYELAKLAINPETIKGYDREEFTHLGVAAAVASGNADVGMGIKSAATALELDFIPITEERYDLLISGEFWDTPYVQNLLAIMKQPNFRNQVQAIAGYDTRDMGKIIYQFNQG